MMLGVPGEAGVLQSNLERHGSKVDSLEAEHMLATIRSTVDEFAQNLAEIQGMVERHDLSGSGAPVDEGHSLRTVDNAFRHGLKILLHDTLPADRAFGVAVHGEAEPLGEYAIDLYQADEEPKFATIDASPQRTAVHVKSVGHISMRLKQAFRGFISAITGQPALLATLATIDIDTLDPSLADGREVD